MAKNTKTKEMFGTVELIDGKKAAEYLLLNYKKNRPIVRLEVEAVKRTMRNGKFKLTSQGLTFNERGNLIDGQTRVTAILELADEIKGFALKLYVTRNAPNDSYGFMDAGRSRNDKDRAREMGFDFSTTEIGYAKRAYMRDGWGDKTRLTSFETIEITDVLINVVRFVNKNLRSTSDVPHLKRAGIVAALVRAYFHTTEDRILEICTILRNGYSTHPVGTVQPIIKLRDEIKNFTATGGEWNVTMFRKATYAISAFLKNEDIGGLKEPKDDLFPFPAKIVDELTLRQIPQEAPKLF